MRHLILFGFCVSLIYFAAGLNLPSVDKKSWNFEFVSLDITSNDETRFKADVKLKQKTRGSYTLTGTILINIDFKENDSNTIEALVYRRATASSEYKITPFTMPRQHFFTFLDTFYKRYLMESLAKCSDFPVFKDKFQPPFEKKTYTLTDCVITNDGMPPYMDAGFYKVEAIGNGTANYKITAVVNVESIS